MTELSIRLQACSKKNANAVLISNEHPFEELHNWKHRVLFDLPEEEEEQIDKREGRIPPRKTVSFKGGYLDLQDVKIKLIKINSLHR
ncbi:hypothetical protein QJS10_CPA05g01795 [Acorus calamus]|uniref:Uncharacterized protein n=1 Tax=Acorus calamus TaxID=4465 RepID=A0AAV9ETJ8_ACOCL|nr:hypothetical protein QJS10_CPA05g01795 [Acorus calamus]